MNLFAETDFRKNELDTLLASVNDMAAKKRIVKRWQDDIVSGKIFQLSETQLDLTFLNQIFGDVLGYVYQDSLQWNVEAKPKTDFDATRPDATLGFFSSNRDKDVHAVVELKSASVNLDNNQRRKDFYGSPVEQAFGYVNKFSENCRWIIVSNFIEIRLYHRYSGMAKYESFKIAELFDGDNLARFFFLFQKDRLFWSKGESPIDKLYANRRDEEKKTPSAPCAGA